MDARPSPCSTRHDAAAAHEDTVIVIRITHSHAALLTERLIGLALVLFVAGLAWALLPRQIRRLIPADHAGTRIAVLAVWGTYVVIVIAALSVMIGVMGLPIGAYVGISLLTGVIVASFQGVLQNAAAGLSLLIGGRIRPGVRITFQGNTGIVLELGLQAIELQGQDGMIYRLPNVIANSQFIGIGGPDHHESDL